MCHYIGYIYDYCKRSEHRQASNQAICIERCPKAQTTSPPENNEASYPTDHPNRVPCLVRHLETVHIRSYCTWRKDEPGCTGCDCGARDGELPPHDQRFGQWIDQGVPGRKGATLPKPEEMVWHVDDVAMTFDGWRDVDWRGNGSGPSVETGPRVAIEYEEDAPGLVPEPLSPKSKLADAREKHDSDGWETASSSEASLAGEREKKREW